MGRLFVKDVYFFDIKDMNENNDKCLGSRLRGA